MKKKKGFTLVELLVVIAILAVLATVSVVGYMGFTKKAHESNDASLTAQMNTALQANGVVKKNKTLTEAREDLLEAGIDLEKVTPTTDGYSYVWDSKQDLMFLLNENRDVVAPTNATISANTVDSFVVVHNETEFNTWKSDYSLYFANGYESQTLTLTKLVGIDAGTSGINNISVKDDSSTADVTMYTTSGTLTIDARQATVRHYGEAKTVSIKAIAGKSYHEYGTVTGNVEVTKGRVELENTADVNTVLVSSATSGDSKVDYNSGAKVGTVAPTTEAAKADVSSSTIPSESKQETIVDTTKTSKFAGGLGTEKSPYLIENADQFDNIGLYEVAMVNTPYYFKLSNNIDLSLNEYSKSYVSYTFNGCLDGNGYIIKSNNKLNNLFVYSLGKTTYKNFTLELDVTLTRIASSQGATSTTEKTELIFENADLKGKDNFKYNIGGNNSAYYANSTFCAVKLISTQNDSKLVIGDNFFNKNQYVKISNCDVYVDFTMTGDRAAVFCGGQVYTMNIEITNCSYNGNFYGANPGLVFANSNCCFDGEDLIGSIKLNNITLNGKLICLNSNNAHGLTFANSDKELTGVNGTNNVVTCSNDKLMDITADENARYVITKASDESVNSYVVQLSLGKLYWYDVDGNVTDIESSNHMISIKVDAKDVNNTNLYKTTALSTRQAKEKNIDVANLEWKESIDGVKYCFVSYENKMVLVLDVNGDFADIEHVNTVNLIGYVDGMPKYYISGK